LICGNTSSRTPACVGAFGVHLLHPERIDLGGRRTALPALIDPEKRPRCKQSLSPDANSKTFG